MADSNSDSSGDEALIWSDKKGSLLKYVSGKDAEDWPAHLSAGNVPACQPSQPIQPHGSHHMPSPYVRQQMDLRYRQPPSSIVYQQPPLPASAPPVKQVPPPPPPQPPTNNQPQYQVPLLLQRPPPPLPPISLFPPNIQQACVKSRFSLIQVPPEQIHSIVADIRTNRAEVTQRNNMQSPYSSVTTVPQSFTSTQLSRDPRIRRAHEPRKIAVNVVAQTTPVTPTIAKSQTRWAQSPTPVALPTSAMPATPKTPVTSTITATSATWSKSTTPVMPKMPVARPTSAMPATPKTPVTSTITATSATCAKTTTPVRPKVPVALPPSTEESATSSTSAIPATPKTPVTSKITATLATSAKSTVMPKEPVALPPSTEESATSSKPRKPAKPVPSVEKKPLKNRPLLSFKIPMKKKHKKVASLDKHKNGEKSDAASKEQHFMAQYRIPKKGTTTTTQSNDQSPVHNGAMSTEIGANADEIDQGVNDIEQNAIGPRPSHSATVKDSTKEALQSKSSEEIEPKPEASVDTQSIDKPKQPMPTEPTALQSVVGANSDIDAPSSVDIAPITVKQEFAGTGGAVEAETGSQFDSDSTVDLIIDSNDHGNNEQNDMKNNAGDFFANLNQNFSRLRFARCQIILDRIDDKIESELDEEPEDEGSISPISIDDSD